MTAASWLQIAGLAALTATATIVSPLLGGVVVGVFLIVIGIALERR